ncbi:hypothetical protein L7F22_044698 [Adiantum nelumboides]|nr:hypothetical protein [Adiantum nelumboides]
MESSACSTLLSASRSAQITNLSFFTLIGIYSFLVLQGSLFWSYATSQRPGFLSIDCGSDVAMYTDHYGINWISDTNYTNEGTPFQLSNAAHRVLQTMRQFDGTHSKYCYSLSNSGGVQAGAFYLVRVDIWAGIAPPFAPKDPDRNFHFKLIVDADEWIDVKVSYGDRYTWFVYEVYVRAQRSSIDVCLAHSSRDGDAPFISSLELRPLPPSLTSTHLMNATDRFLVAIRRAGNGVASLGPSLTRYSTNLTSLDSLNRIWKSYSSLNISELMNTTASANDVSAQNDELLVSILQNAYTASPANFRKLQNNNLSGLIPAALLQRKQASLLDFEFSENFRLCESPDAECLSPPSSPSTRAKSSTGIIIGVTLPDIAMRKNWYWCMILCRMFDCLHGPTSDASPLSWVTRLQILVDAAEGLEYLHRSCDPPIIHRDIKSSNILLNDKMVAKLSDFGISRNNMTGGTEATLTPLMGTMGYIDPEYFSDMKLTENLTCIALEC